MTHTIYDSYTNLLSGISESIYTYMVYTWYTYRYHVVFIMRTRVYVNVDVHDIRHVNA